MNASVSAGVVIKRTTDESKAFGWEVLFVLRPDGTYGLPAGHLENETPRQCAVRECLEETGYQVTLDGLLRVITIGSHSGVPLSIGFVFSGKLGNRTGNGQLEIKWISPQQFTELLGQQKIFLPQFHIPAFWDKELAPLDVVFESVV